MSWRVHAVKYAERNARTRRDSFLMDPAHEPPHDMDYFLWVLERDGRVILVDTGYDAEEGAARGRPISIDPREALKPLGIAAESVAEVIVTHLHYDHAGGLALFPNATIHVQAAEMAFATGPCMCEDFIRAPFTADHICEAVKRLYSGRMVFHDGDGEVTDGITVHRIGGHSRGLQAVRVLTDAGWLCLASDAGHYYENIFDRKPFPLVVDVEDMLKGFATVETLASSRGLIIPGHDPLVRQHFPAVAPGIHRLDKGPTKDFTS